MIKLNKGEVQEATRDPLTIFREGIKSPSTLKKYERRLKIFLCHILEDYLTGDSNLREKQRRNTLNPLTENNLRSWMLIFQKEYKNL